MKGTMIITFVVGLVMLLAAGTAAQIPAVVSVTPAQNALQVDANTDITVTFDIDMNPATIIPSSFLVVSKSKGYLSGTVTYSEVTLTATFDPAVDFDNGDIISVILTSDIQSLGGVPLDGGFTWSFTVVVSDDPGDFAPRDVYDVGTGPYDVVAADVNDDGLVDMVSVDAADEIMTVLINQGDGTFAAASTPDIGSDCWSVVAFDMDRDGDMDLATPDRNASAIYILKGFGDGTFLLDSLYATGSGCQSIVAADFNGDGAADLATANSGGSSVSVLLNDGSGVFAAHADYSCGGGPLSVCAGDLDNDGDIDVATANPGGGVAVLLNDGTGVLTLEDVFSAGGGNWSVTAADLDGDGYQDIATTNFMTGKVTVLINDGTATSWAATGYTVGSRPFSVAVGDLNADGAMDMITANYNSDDLSILYNLGSGVFDTHILYDSDDGPAAVNVADLDDDGDLDILAAAQIGSKVMILRNELSLVPTPSEISLSVFGGGDNPAPISVVIESNGDDLTYTVSDNAAWLDATPLFGMTPGTTSVLIDIEGLVVGAYYGEVVFTPDNPEALARSVAIELHITNRPADHRSAFHNRGEIAFTVSNNGTFGSGFVQSAMVDYFTGEPLPSCEYPKGSGNRYLFAGALWVGAVVGQDTLVSVGADGWSAAGEMFSVDEGDGALVRRSTLDPMSPEYAGAISEQDYIAAYTDTVMENTTYDYFGRPHVPLNIKITQSSYAWSYPYAEDFVLMDYALRNIGYQRLEDVYIGFYVDGDVYHESVGSIGFQDDLTGFIETATVYSGFCQYTDTVNLAWIADDDGDLSTMYPVPAVAATCLLRSPAESPEVSYNWWISNGNAELDFGPRERSYVGAWPEEFRDFQTGGIGTPEGDINKYYQMRNREFDYDQIFTAQIQPTDPLWMYPNQATAVDFANGYDTRYLLSFGPFDINPGETLPLTVAKVMGDNLHTNPDNVYNLPDDPELYYDNLEFSDLTLNARWASWIYDNPGVDTDGDGYAGQFQVCCMGTVCDTIWTAGDGVPDFRAASPPPAPKFWLDPGPSSMEVRFNGLASETTHDIFSRRIDFEGYNIYLSLDGSAGSFAAVGSYDIEDFTKYVWYAPTASWQVRDYPFTIEELRCLYGTSCGDLGFNPLFYTESTPYVLSGYPDSIFYFEAVGLNHSVFGVETPIVKTYPGQPYPTSLDPASAQPDELTADGYLKYFEYRMTITDLLPDNCYFVNVTATDYGNPDAAVPPLESGIMDGVQTACVNTFVCGDINNDGDEQLDIADLTYLVDYMFLEGPPPPLAAAADVDGSGLPLDIGDLVYLIDYMFRGGPAPHCGL